MQEIGSIICQFACYNLLSSTWPFLNHAWLVKQYQLHVPAAEYKGIYMYWPNNIWSKPFPTLFPGSTLLAGPKHSTSVPFSAEVAVLVSLDEKKGPFVPNPASGKTVKPLQKAMAREAVCKRTHSLLPPTLQMVSPLLSPVTVQLKVNVSPGQVGGAAVNCPATSPRVIGYSYIIS